MKIFDGIINETVKEMEMRFKDGKSKALTLSYDDAVIQDKRLVELMAPKGMKCTFNVCSGKYLPEGEKRVKGNKMSLSEAKENFKDTVHEIAVHCYNHSCLTDLSDEEIAYEINEDRRRIEEDYGCIARGMAYPYGAYDSRVEDVIKKSGMVYGRTIKSTEAFILPENWLEWNPTCHHNNPGLMELAKIFCEESEPFGKAGVFFLWGHTYEFDTNDNWRVIEEFIEYAGGREDIWYATNIEIYDYVEAYRKLSVDCGEKKVYNPSATDVWAEIKGKLYCIKGGETLTV